MYVKGRETVEYTPQRHTGPCKPIMLYARWLVIALSLPLFAPAAMAQTLSQTELQKLLASDSTALDNFGWSVSISGGRALVGAPFDDDAGSASGSAYVYERDAAGMWIQATKLNASDAAFANRFGFSVAISGDRALVGADRGTLGNSGSVYVYERNLAGMWVQVAKLTAGDGATEDKFGHSVALSGDRALVGAPANDSSGSVYVFEPYSTGTWVQVAKFTNPNVGGNYYFGNSVSLSDDRALVGAYSDFGRVGDSGSAFVFERGLTGTWVQVARLTASDAAVADLFGISVSLSGDRALVGGISGSDVNTGYGSAYIFERGLTGTWAQVARLTVSDANAKGAIHFGSSVSLSGDRALVAAPSYGNNLGAAYAYERDESGTWIEVAELTASDTAPNARFGSSVALSGDRVLVGANGAESAYLFDVTTFGDAETEEVSIHTSCLAGNGRLTVNLLNGSTASSAYALQFEGLTTRERTVAFEDWGRISITGRPAGEYAVTVLKDGDQISSTSVVFNCNENVPDVSEPEVSVINACRNGLGQVFFQMVNPTPDTKGYVIEFEGVRNRSTSATAYGQARRGTTGRPNGSYDYLVKNGTTNISHGNVVVDCN